MERRLSKRGTCVSKVVAVIFLIVFAALCWSGSLLPFRARSYDAAFLGDVVFVLLVAVVAAYHIWYGLRLKSVTLFGEFLRVSSCWREGSIAFSQIRDVTERRWLPGPMIVVHFRDSTQFGSRIYFRPRYSFMWLWSGEPHPDADALRRLAHLPRD